MENLNEQQVIKKLHLDRDIIMRLWESYAKDMLNILKLFEARLINLSVFEKTSALIAPVLSDLKMSGKIDLAVKKSQIVILNRIFSYIEMSREKTKNKLKSNLSVLKKAREATQGKRALKKQ